MITCSSRKRAAKSKKINKKEKCPRGKREGRGGGEVLIPLIPLIYVVYGHHNRISEFCSIATLRSHAPWQLAFDVDLDRCCGLRTLGDTGHHGAWC